MLNLQFWKHCRTHNATFLPYYAQTIEHQPLTNTPFETAHKTALSGEVERL